MLGSCVNTSSNLNEKKLASIISHSASAGHNGEQTKEFVKRFKLADVEEKRMILKELKAAQASSPSHLKSVKD